MVNKTNQLFVILGPTASGKTKLALELAKLQSVEIISADSRQVYKYLNIGTAKPNQKEMESVPHHLIDFLEPDEKYNAGRFADDCLRIITEVQDRGNLPIIVGGTGLYLSAVLDGFSIQSPSDPELRKKLEFQLEKNGINSLYQQLQLVDPQSAKEIHPNNKQHILRALEIYYVSGIAKSNHSPKKENAYSGNIHLFGLDWKRAELYERINARVLEMINRGLIDEVHQLLKMGFNQNLNSLQTVGYSEVFAHLSGEYSYDRMIELIQQNSRHYAKRQITWFRKDKRIHWISCDSQSNFTAIAKLINSEFSF